MSKKKTEKTESEFIPGCDINIIKPEVSPEENKRRVLEEISKYGEPPVLTTKPAHDELVKHLHDFIDHTEARLHSIREYLKTVKHDGRKLLGDEDLDAAFGKGFWSK